VKLAIIDYGRGNLHSVHSGFEKAAELAGLDVNIQVTHDPAWILAADKVCLPGVGAMGDCFAQLKAAGLDQIVRQCFAQKPFLGICVGMQILFEAGDEHGGCEGLGLVAGQVVRFPKSELKVPHMGWSPVTHKPHPVLVGIPAGARFYFVHSYHVLPADPDLVLASAPYGVSVPAVIGRDNWLATQFHPEKSHQWGLQLLANFLNWSPTLS